MTSSQRKFLKLSDTEKYKKLNRKLKRALRLKEPYADILAQMVRLDEKIGAVNPTWIMYGYTNVLEKSKQVV